MNRRHPKYVSLLVIGLLALAFASCSGEETDAVSQAPAPAEDEQEAQGQSADEASDSADEPSSGETAFATTEAIGMTLAWRISGAELEVELTGPTTGWIAVGFNPSRAMKDANILIGYVDGGEAVMTDQFGTTMIAHRRDEEIGGSSDTRVISGTESGGETTIRFAIPLDSGDEYDQPLAAGESVRVILAYGPDGADDTQTYHEDRAGLDIDL